MTKPAVIEEKVNRYEILLQRALSSFEVAVQDKSHLSKVAEDFSTMAKAYYDDGRFFLDQGDKVNALACFSYGHAWLDAGVKLGVFKVSDQNLFTI